MYHITLLILLHPLSDLLHQFVLLMPQKIFILLLIIIIKSIHILYMEMPPQESIPYIF